MMLQLEGLVFFSSFLVYFVFVLYVFFICFQVQVNAREEDVIHLESELDN